MSKKQKQPEKKIKLFYYGDINKRTGFGQIADNLIPGLLKTGLFDIVAFGINYHGEKHGYPIHVYPVDSSDVYGVHSFARHVMNEIPDIIFALQDLFIMDQLVAIREKNFPHIPIVGYFPIDGNNLPTEWAKAIEKIDQPVTYSQYGYQLVKHQVPKARNLQMIYHGIDTKQFRILPLQEREAKRNSLRWNDKFVIGVFNRFQPRKSIGVIMRAFSLFHQGYKKCLGCGHYYHITSPMCDLNMCDAPFEIHAGHEEARIYLHMNPQEYIMGGHANDIGKLLLSNSMYGDDLLYMPGVDIYGDSAPDGEEMVRMYNAVDVFLNGTVGEGFGLTIAEAMACGLPVISPINTTGPELLGDGRGKLIRNSAFVNMPSDSGHLRPVFYLPDMVDALEEAYQAWKKDGFMSNHSNHYWVKQNLNWSVIVERFAALIAETYTKRAQALSTMNLEAF